MYTVYIAVIIGLLTAIGQCLKYKLHRALLLEENNYSSLLAAIGNAILLLAISITRRKGRVSNMRSGWRLPAVYIRLLPTRRISGWE
jgi:hypothetical protein